jgi:hypothetical protein
MIRFIKSFLVFPCQGVKILLAVCFFMNAGFLSLFSQSLVVYEDLTICPGIDYTIGEPNPQQGHFFSWSPEFYFLNPQAPLQTINFNSGSPDPIVLDI